MKIILPDDVKVIVSRLISNGYEAYAVGGCVRDSIIRRVPGDWDITTSARPEEVKKLFKHTINTGIQHGTVTVMLHHTGYEVTTYRLDGEYEDGRHPKSVEFTNSLIEDLKRRDFTINAMAYNDETGLVDEFDGREDLRSGIIRCVGNPAERFGEDALRMLRAVRFSAQLGFEIERDTAAAIKELAPSIAKVSKERIHTEFGKILLSPHPEYMGRVYEYGLSRYTLPELDSIAERETALKLAGRVPEKLFFRYASLLYELGADGVRNALKSLKLDNRTVDGAVKLSGLHGMELSDDEKEIRRLASRCGADWFSHALEFEACYYEVTKQKTLAEAAEKARELFKTITDRGDCLDTKNLAIDGAALIACGIQPGKEVGRLLNEALELVLENPEINTRERILELLSLGPTTHK
ncbi:MAG: CCA tRNA nucleotidyltransferase [Butyrivibrio sp.]|nr:CCA tRNA nucleotidyltransferase [Butyrivibrio sp.]